MSIRQGLLARLYVGVFPRPAAMYLLAVSMFSVLAPRAVAQTTWDASPLEDANLGVNALLAIVTVIQLAIAITFPFRVESQHIAPGIAAIIALLLMFLAYVLSVVSSLVSFITDGSLRNPAVSPQVFENINSGV